MQDTMIDVRQIYSLTDFLKNHKVHIAHLKETKTPEVLTVNGRAEVVILDAESYQNLMARMQQMESITAARRLIAQDKQTSEVLTLEEIDRRMRVVDELTAETERLGLYR